MEAKENFKSYCSLQLFNPPDILLKHCVKEVHVVALRLDCVREETESLVPQKAVNWDLTKNKFLVLVLEGSQSGPEQESVFV